MQFQSWRNSIKEGMREARTPAMRGWRCPMSQLSKGESGFHHGMTLAHPAGDVVDVLQRAAQRAARRDISVGEVDDLHAQFTKAAFELKALLGSLPVVALEHHVETEVFPDRHLVIRQRRVSRIDVAHVAH